VRLFMVLLVMLFWELAYRLGSLRCRRWDPLRLISRFPSQDGTQVSLKDLESGSCFGGAREPYAPAGRSRLDWRRQSKLN
jgi:hypothetical protein